MGIIHGPFDFSWQTERTNLCINTIRKENNTKTSGQTVWGIARTFPNAARQFVHWCQSKFFVQQRNIGNFTGQRDAQLKMKTISSFWLNHLRTTTRGLMEGWMERKKKTFSRRFRVRNYQVTRLLLGWSQQLLDGDISRLCNAQIGM